MLKEQLEAQQMSVDDTQRILITLKEVRDCLASPYLQKEEEETLMPLTIALASELIFFGNYEDFKEEVQ